MADPRVLIIDDRADFRALLCHHVTVRWPGAALQTYDPLTSGRPRRGFAASGVDVVLLGDPAGQGDALEWLRQFRGVPRFPPVIFLGGGDERQIVAAIKAGAENYVTKSTLNHGRLLEAVQAALDGASRVAGPAAEAAPAGLPSLKGYEFERQLAAGEVSTVWLARERAAGRVVVLKVLNHVPDRGGEKIFDRFLQEYELIARVRHPNVVRIYDLGVADDHAFIAMEYCSRGSLKRRIAQGIAPEEAVSIVRQIGGALGALHGVGIFHRDLKPTNVMFREDGSLVLIDFGLAKQAHFHAEITGTGAIFGTPYYMSPEQGAGARADQRSDIYSLGVIFYEMLTGQKPFEGASAMAVIIQHREAPVPRLPASLATFQPLVDRMLAKEPAARFASVDELLSWRSAA